jgi:hypothetical protein
MSVGGLFIVPELCVRYRQFTTTTITASKPFSQANWGRLDMKAYPKYWGRLEGCKKSHLSINRKIKSLWHEATYLAFT